MTTRAQYRPWRPEYTGQAPLSCRELGGSIWGHSCAATSTAPRSECLPWLSSATPAASLEYDNDNDHIFYSPGTACPPGWEASKTRTTSSRDGSTFSDEWIHGETAITCCPGNFGAYNSEGRCRIDSRQSWTKVHCNADGPSTETGILTANGANRPYAPQLVLRYQQSDLGQPLVQPTSSGLSLSAKIVIGVVIPVVVIALIVGGLFLFRRRKKQRRRLGAVEKSQSNTEGYRKAELEATEASPAKVTYAMTEQPAINQTSAELDGTSGLIASQHRTSAPAELSSEQHAGTRRGPA